MSIIATRIHRSLTDFVSSNTEMYGVHLIPSIPAGTIYIQNSDSKVQKLKVTMDSLYEHH